jgi:hypothetical protein
MFPHPNTVSEVRMMQNRDLLAVAARERLAKEATRNVLTPSRSGSGRGSVSRMLAGMSAMAAMSLSTRRLAKAWS